MTQYFSRAAKSLAIRQGPPVYETLENFSAPSEPCKFAGYSPDGSVFAYSTAEKTLVVDPETGTVRCELPISAADFYFSPLGTNIVTWVRPTKDAASGNWNPNLVVWSTKSGEKLGEFVQKSQGSFKGGWHVQYTADEKFVVRQANPKELVVSDTPGGPAKAKLHIPDGIAEFSVSHGQNPSVAVFILGVKGKPGSVRIYRLPTLNHPVAQRTLFKAESVQLLWNVLGTSLLVVASTDVDQTGKSYYGESTLYLLTSNSGSDQRIMLDREGPVLDVTWSPEGDEFGVVYGHMPSKTTFFNGRGAVVHELGLEPRNTLKYSPHGRFVAVAGFGNLRGLMDIYDRQTGWSKLATIQASNTTTYDWSPDGRVMLTATTSPRLRVDNGIKLWHVSGKLLYTHDDTELYTVAWRPQSIPYKAEPCPTPHSSAADKAVEVATKPKGAYRPPHARSSGTSAQQQSLYQRSLANAGTTSQDISKSALKNKKRAAGAGTGTNTGQGPSQPQALSNATSEEKQIRSLVKKLRAIQELKDRKSGGDKLEVTQLQKIETEKDVLKKLEALGWQG